LMRRAAETGIAFHIKNARNPAAATALLMSPEALERFVFAPVAQRTLAQVLDALPFKRMGTSPVRTDVPDNVTRPLRAPRMKGGSRS
jgi:hypothetical protein